MNYELEHLEILLHIQDISNIDLHRLLTMHLLASLCSVLVSSLAGGQMNRLFSLRNRCFEAGVTSSTGH
jgi:hypothetical protein